MMNDSLPHKSQMHKTPVLGFFCAVGASVFWGAGNVIIRWTAKDFPTSPLDITLAKYLVAGTLITTITAVYIGARRNKYKFRPSKLQLRLFAFCAIAKAADTYLWNFAATQIPAVQVVTFNNLHIIWTTAAVIILFRQRVPGTWMTGSVVLLVATWLITSIAFSSTNAPGLASAIASSLAFATFIVAWTGAQDPSTPFGYRTLTMGLFLIAAGLLVYPIHLGFRVFDSTLPLIPMASTPINHLAMQSLNGIIGIAITYLLVNEASTLLVMGDVVDYINFFGEARRQGPFRLTRCMQMIGNCRAFPAG